MPKLTRRAEKQLKTLPREVQVKAKEIISRIDSEPILSKKLLGPLKGKYRVCIGRAYRIIYSIESGMIVIHSIGARKDIYR